MYIVTYVTEWTKKQTKPNLSNKIRAQNIKQGRCMQMTHLTRFSCDLSSLADFTNRVTKVLKTLAII